MLSVLSVLRLIRFILACLISSLWFNAASGRQLTEVVYTSQQHDEPPTTTGRRDPYQIRFVLVPSGDLVAHHYQRERKRIKLQKPLVIPRGRVDTLIRWLATNQRKFSPAELGLDEDSIRKSLPPLHLPPPQNLVIDVDSFSFCAKHTMIGLLKTGGTVHRVNLHLRNGQRTEFVFDSPDPRTKDFNLQAYLFTQKVLNGVVPPAFPDLESFSPVMLKQVFQTYWKVIACEGFYYTEFSRSHPELSSDEKRRTWNFAKYLRGRK
ncbi:MAG: hypothetical protein MUC97_17060 [Bernardetiaceae bacterium]|nr:hypothetical protein [Bernardetiaceae bacterium]